MLSFTHSVTFYKRTRCNLVACMYMYSSLACFRYPSGLFSYVHFCAISHLSHLTTSQISTKNTAFTERLFQCHTAHPQFYSAYMSAAYSVVALADASRPTDTSLMGIFGLSSFRRNLRANILSKMTFKAAVFNSVGLIVHWLRDLCTCMFLHLTWGCVERAMLHLR